MGVEKLASVILNEGSGSRGAPELAQQIQEAFREHGVHASILPLSGPPSPRRVASWVRDAPGQLAVAGGDGTINMVASACRRAGRPFGIIPGGTFNYVARNLGLPADVRDAVRVIVEGTPLPMAAGEINGHLFLNNTGFGLYSHMIEQREVDKQRFGRHRLVAFLSGLRVLSRRFPLYDLTFQADGREHALRTTTLFFGVNALQLENYKIGVAECVARGQLAVLSLRIDSRLDIAEAALAALLGKTEAATSVGATCASSVQVSTRRRSLKIAVDGEILVVRPPLTVRFVPDALQVFQPAAASNVDVDDRGAVSSTTTTASTAT